MLKEFGDLIVSLGEASDEHWERGTTNLKEGFRKMFSGSSSRVEFKTPVDVLNFLLSEVPKGNCEIAKLSENDDYETILNWVRQHKKGNKFYLVRGKFKSGEHAIGVFFADNERVYANVHDPKICYTCSVIPVGVKDLFGQNLIYVQQFN